MIKTQKEIILLKKSAAIADSCIKIIEDSLREDITEKELARRIRTQLKKNNAGESFRTLVASGKRSAMVHAHPYAANKKIRGIGYVDFGAKYNGYCSDITVPFIKGKITKRQEKIVQTTLSAYKLAMKSIKLNESCWKLFQKIMIFINENGFRVKHGLGHGLGKKIHEYPSIVMPIRKKIKHERRWEKIKKMKFQTNMIFTIEPGIYVNGVGGCRLENDVLMTKSGPKVLTHAKLLRI
jgi:Xaa-Pro dipeptidase